MAGVYNVGGWSSAEEVTAMTVTFEGFPADTARFLAELARNNNRDWFRANKGRYERSVRGPALAFIEAMAGPLERVSRHIYADPSPSGGSLMRIYRDTRFSPDKTPYKTNIGIQFRHERCDDVHAPGLYFHIDPKECFLACGMWRQPPTPCSPSAQESPSTRTYGLGPETTRLSKKSGGP